MGFNDKTWNVSEFVTAASMNLAVRDNQRYLLNERPYGDAFINAGGTYTTTSATPVLVNSSLSKVVNFTGTRAWVFFAAGVAAVTGFATGWLYVDGVQNARLFNQVQGAGLFIAQLVLSGIVPGARTFEVRWQIASGGTATMYQQAANGATTQGNAISFTVMEW